MKVTGSQDILKILKNDLLNVNIESYTIFNQKARCLCFYIAI